MKIALLAPANNVHTKKWLDYYNKMGYEVLNISFESHRDEGDRNQWGNVSTHYLKLMFQSKLSYFLTINELRKVLNDFKPDLTHSHYVSSYGVVGAMANVKPYIISVWGSDIYDFPREGKINEFLIKYALKKADEICSTSFVMKDETKLYTDKHVHVTPFGVDMNYFKPDNRNSSSEKVTFGIVKTMKEKYGIRYLLEGYKKLKDTVDRDKFSNTGLEIVGGGPLLEDYKKLAVKLGIENQTTFHGQINHSDVPDMINSFDVFFVPSTLDSESFGVAAVEAQACGVPVVVANVGGLPEVVKENETGFIIPTKNSNEIAEKMEFFLNNPQEGKIMGEKGRKHVLEHYEWESNANIMSELYNKVLEGVKNQ